MAKKSFRMPKPDRPPEEFELIFQVRDQADCNVGTVDAPVWAKRDVDPPTWSEEIRTFHARMNIPGGITLALAPPKDGDLDAAARIMQAIRDLMRIAVVEADDFFELLDSPRTVVPGESLGEICRWIIEEAGDRPTNGPSISSAG
jgi:hypothetical protein